MNEVRDACLLPEGKEVPFGEIESALAERDRRPSAARGSMATVVVVGAPSQLDRAAEALHSLGESGGVRAILIAEGTESAPPVRISECAIAILGLTPRYLNNAVAALRLPSLPAVVWWRGGSLKALEDVTTLADRLVLDTDNPEDVWRRANSFLDQTAVTDLRWTRLTRWRALMAHVFDLPQVRAAIPTFRRLSIEASDRPSARLFAAWLVSSLARSQGLEVQLASAEGDAASVLESVQLVGHHLSISVRLLPARDCLEASVDGDEADVRIAPLGETTLAAYINEELAVRSRDLAFERALGALRRIAA